MAPHDGQGRTVTSPTAVLIMTSNLVGAIPFTPSSRNSSTASTKSVRFRPWEERTCSPIVGIQLGQLKKRLEARRMMIEVTPEAEMWLGDQVTTPISGAPPAAGDPARDRLIPLAIALLEGRYKEGEHMSPSK